MADHTKNDILDSGQKMTPMMAQWARCKASSPQGSVVLFRLGDFYEAFHEDAHVVAKSLDLTLTKRQEVPMCGIPWHSSENYIDRLIQMGFAVAIAEQVEPEKAAITDKKAHSKTIMERKIVRVLSPGTALSSTLLQEHNFQYIASLFYGSGNRLGLALIDMATGVFYVAEAQREGEAEKEKIIQEIIKRRPKEIVISKQFQNQERNGILLRLEQSFSYRKSIIESWMFDATIAYETLKNHFKIHNLEVFGLENKKNAYSAGGGLLTFIRDTLYQNVDHLRSVEYLEAVLHMQLDVATLCNLDIFESDSQRGDAKSLFDILNETKTPMGARLLRSQLLQPSLNIAEIEKRLDTVEAYLSLLARMPHHIESLQNSLLQVRDIERLIHRIKATAAQPKDIAYLANCLQAITGIEAEFEKIAHPNKKIKEHYLSLPQLTTPLNIIRTTLCDEPPLRIGDGDVIKRGICSELDEIKQLKSSSEAWLVSYQNRLREDLEIKTLKVGFSRAFGYYIEVSRNQADKMPSSFSRRQTLTTGERFISAELIEFERKILSSEAKIIALETELFSSLVKNILSFSEVIIKAAKVVAEIDYAISLAYIAFQRNYTRPKLILEPIIEIYNGRHPIAELCTTSSFTPNNLTIDAHKNSFLLITGPNMAGKSTYIRQSALLVIMAQLGSFIPASSSTIGLVDRIFSRIGASDDLARGQSTFMVEMTETAHILHAATEKSLVLLDEIGRGTSTYDGLSIAWAVTEYLTRFSHANPRTLFATHYHELTRLDQTIPFLSNMTVAVCETAQGIQFLYKIILGKADKSYGIHVAELAGLPITVTQRAKEILSQLEKTKEAPAIDNELTSSSQENHTFIPSASQNIDHEINKRDVCLSQKTVQMQCFELLTALDLVQLTPLECFIQISQFQQSILKKQQQ